MGRRRYRSFMADSGRWEGFEHRDGDVVISTPPKSGTTWMQALVALVLFDGAPPGPVNELSPWLDMVLRPRDEVVARYGRQSHRRFIKTHTPLDGLPLDDRVTYVVVGRDPRDVLVSMRDHLANMDMDRVWARREAVAGVADLVGQQDRWPDGDDLRAHVAAFLELPAADSSTDVALATVVGHLRGAWALRDRGNVHLFHYADLRRDLPGQLQGLGGVLGVPVPPDRAAVLAARGSFATMRAAAVAHTPEVDAGGWRDVTAFFRSGRLGEGAGLMTPAELRRYEHRLAELGLGPTLTDWVHGGWGALRTGVGG